MKKEYILFPLVFGSLFLGIANSPFWRGDSTGTAPVSDGGRTTIIGGSSSASLTTDAVCDPFGNVCNTTPSASKIGAVIPSAATIKNLYGVIGNSPSPKSSCAFTVRKSASCTGPYADTALACAIAGNGSLRTCSNTTATVNVGAGDCLQVFFDETGTCSGFANWGFEASF